MGTAVTWRLRDPTSRFSNTVQLSVLYYQVRLQIPNMNVLDSIILVRLLSKISTVALAAL